jgi:hypothetical protein
MNQGTFDMGGGQQLQVSIDGKTPENFLKDKASSMIWGWVIGAVILGIVLITFVGVGIYVYVAAKDTSSPASEAKAAEAAKWDGKSTFTCGGNDNVTLKKVTAKVEGTAIKASANCQLTLVDVNITAPVGIEAGGNAKVTMASGSIKATTNSVVASANAQVNVTGATVTGPAKKSGLAKITGAN